METQLLNLAHQPGTQVGAVVGLLAYPIIRAMASPILAWLAKYLLAGTAKITPIVAQGTTTACVWALQFPLVRSIVTTNPKACETLVDTASNCLSAIILTVQTTVDQEIASAGLQQAAPAASGTPGGPN